ncbi:MAG: S-layer homology domain-containing protein, partial [Firmicutes bacterium]|nr:S-layer homology domain-containing protein [Bacillota bacterium]
CGGCGTCENCATICELCGEHCTECSVLCGNCGACEDCATICPSCGEACSECSTVCGECGTCENCATICDSCGDHCSECAEICGNCGYCEYCAEICPNCGEACSECSQVCGDCGYCENCATICDSCGDHCSECAELCGGCGTCEYCADICGECGEACSSCSTICEDCELCEDCCAEVSKAAGCDHGVCVMSSEWDSHWEAEHEGEEHNHVLDEEWNTDENEHWRSCKVASCDYEERAYHKDCLTAYEEKPATCTEDGTAAYYVCECGMMFEDEEAANEISEPQVLPAPGHAYGETWKKNYSGHWKVCETCGEKTEKEAHVFSDNTCTVCGYKKSVSDDSSDDSGTTTPSDNTGDSSGSGNTGDSTGSENAGSNTEAGAEAGGESPVTTTVVDEATGAVTETTEYPDGTTVETVTDSEGNTTATVDLPEGKDEAEVEIPVDLGDKEGTVTVEVTDKDGNTETVEASYADGKITVPVTDGATVKVGDDFKENEEKSITPFSDVPAGAWYADAAAYMAENGIMDGVGNNRFDPSGSASRAMILTVLYRLEGEPAVSGNMPFDDVAAGQWYSDAIIWAYGKGIVEGYGNGKFGPSNETTREQLATILYRYAQYKGKAVSPDANTLDFDDALEVSDWAVEAVRWAVQMNLIQGSNNKLLPGQGATRAQVAAMLMRFIENIK